MTIAGVVLFFWLGFIYAQFQWEIKELENQTQNLTQSLGQLTQVRERVRELENLQNEITRLRGLSGMVKQVETNWSQVLADIARVIPPGLKFSEVDLKEDDRLVIKGESTSQVLVAQYAFALRELTWFSSIEVVKVNRNDKGVITFELTAVLPKEGGKPDGQKPPAKESTP
jgi:Tfp pilus assembly protein PilN